MNYLFRSDGLYSAVNLSGFQSIFAEKNWLYDKHRHPSYELLHCLSGQIIQSVGNQTYHLSPGDTLIIQAGAFHHTKILEDCHFLDFHFNIESFELNQQLHQLESLLIKKDESHQISHWIDEILEKLKRIQYGQQIDNSSKAPLHSALFELELHAYMLFLLTEIIKTNTISPLLETNIENSNERMLASEMAEIINRYSNTHFKISDLGIQMNLNRTYLSTLFSKVYGMSPKEYHLNVKLELSKKLLLETYLSIEKIADELNFSSASHFSRFFKQQQGIPPSTFRNQHFK